MPTFDETDREILGLLLADARRPYSEIAEAVDLSPPAVSDRVSRLEDAGVIDRFTLALDRSTLQSGTPVMLWLTLAADGPPTGETRSRLLERGAVDHVFTTAGGDLVVSARLPDTDVAGWLADAVAPGAVADVDVTLLSGVDWAPDLPETTLALACAECGNTVDDEGTTASFDDERYHFCCASCERRFGERYERHRAGAD